MTTKKIKATKAVVKKTTRKKRTGQRTTADAKEMTTSSSKTKKKVVPNPDNSIPENRTDIEARAPEEADISFPVVGVGASAGGLEAFRELLKHLPTDTGMAFVLIQHLDPHHESLLAPLLARTTSMPVSEARDNMKVEPNNVYVISPDTNMGILHNSLQLVQREAERGRYLPVDWFLRTLAEDRGASAIGVVLSGTASDGTLGLKAIKAANGLTFAQDEFSAEYYGMPGSAIAAGCVDFILSPQQIALEIARIARHPYLLHERLVDPIPESGDQLNKVFLLLRSRTGRDFTYYKHSTLRRRIKRRLLVHKLDRMKDYVRLLEQNPAEVDALFQDILINVTEFFRDQDSFLALENEVLPRILKRPQNAQIRIWAPGCSSGEEVYSIAIILQELMGMDGTSQPVQIFGTDIDPDAIEQARRGIYSERIVNEVSPERLKRFFAKVSTGYQISKGIRDMCIFAEQDVTKDPPFSKLDLVCCRNLMIYLGSVLQKKVLQIFHYALQPTGVLMLGTSESIGGHADLFRVMDAKNKLYTKKTLTTQASHIFTPQALFQDGLPEAHPRRIGQSTLAYDLHQEADQLVLARYGPPGVVINQDMEILSFRGETGPYFNPMPGTASLNLMKLARQELAIDLRAAVHKALKEGKPVRKEAVRVRMDVGPRLVDLQIFPMQGPVEQERSLLVLFEKQEPKEEESARDNEGRGNSVVNNRIRELEQELAANREYMRSIIEEQEASNEELQSANEEIQSTNEELQSSNEELETAKEELQSTNEELATVNEELENRNLELVSANNDLNNLMSSVNLPILMLGEDLRVRQFTRQAEKLLNLIGADIGRPVSQIRPNVDIPDMESMVTEVIHSMAIKSRELQDNKGHWYSMRARPYKTMDNRIQGAVITFIDIDDIKDAEQLRRMRDELLASEERLKAILENSAAVIYLKDASGCYQLINRRFEELFGLNRDVVIGKTDHDLFPKSYANQLRANDRLIMKANEPITFEEKVPQHDGDHVYVSVKFPLHGADGEISELCGISTDITQHIRDETKLRQSCDQILLVINMLPMQLAYLDRNERYMFANKGYAERYGLTVEALMGRGKQELMGADAYLRVKPHIENVLAGKEQEFAIDLPDKEGGLSRLQARYVPHLDAQQNVAGFFSILEEVQ